MKYVAISIAALSLIVVPKLTRADGVADASQVLTQWEPASIELTAEGRLRVVLDERRITDTIYYAVIQSGFCFGPLLDIDMDGINSVLVLNNLQTQGWLFEAGADACTAINEAPANQARVIIAGMSQTLTDTANGL